MADWQIEPDKNSGEKFNNYATFCVGTGRMGLALQHAYQDELRTAQALSTVE